MEHGIWSRETGVQTSSLFKAAGLGKSLNIDIHFSMHINAAENALRSSKEVTYTTEPNAEARGTPSVSFAFLVSSFYQRDSAK